MDIALKQRLVGASVLVALGVIFIPMLLDGPRTGEGHEGSRIPDPPDRRFESRLLPVNPGSPPPEEDPPESSMPRSLPVTRGEPVAVDPPPQPAPETTESPSPAQAPRQEQTPTAPVEPPTVPAQSSGEWVLQLGSFGNAANAARLVENLSAAGYNGYQERVSVGDQTLYRVRVGFWDSKDAAVAAGGALGREFSGIDLSVRQLEQAPPAPAAELRGWMVQVGSFSQQANALSLRDRLRAGGFSALVEAIGQNGQTSYRVRVGPALDRGEAEDTRRRLREQFELNGILVSHP